MTSTSRQGAEPILLAFSGGLDTSFCVPWLKDTYQRPVITVTVDTGGIDAAAAQSLAERSAQLGALEHHLIDARAAYFEQVLKFLIMGNVRRGGVYPLCVGAERVLQAQTIAQIALSLNTKMVAHCCTAAGNDQVRFEVALRTLAPDLEIIAPVRDRAFKRPEQLKYLEEHRLPIPPFGGAYSVNRGLWGVTIGGKETLTSQGSIPEEAWVLSKDAFSNPRPAARHSLGFEHGVPTSVDGTPMSAHQFMEMLFGKLPEFFKNEDELRALWSDPETRARLLIGLAEKGFGSAQLTEMQKIIDAENSDLFDVLAYVAYASPMLTRQERAAQVKRGYSTQVNYRQQEFIDFVLSHYVSVGVEELSKEKLNPLLRLKYHDSIADAVADLGKTDEIGKIFAGFQRYLYDKASVRSPQL